MTNPTSNPNLERYVIVAGGDGYMTATITGREAMERAFVRAHWPDVDFTKPLDEEQQQTLGYVRDEDEWEFEPRMGRTRLIVRYEDGYVEVLRLTDDLVGSAHETSAPTAPMLTVFWREVIKVADSMGLKKGMGLDVTLGWDVIEAARHATRLPEEPTGDE